MAKKRDKWIEAIAKLTKMTQDNTLIWRSGEVPDYLKNVETVKVGIVYITKYKNKILRIYEKKAKEYTTGSSFFGMERGPVWNEYIILDFADPSGASLWTFPDVQGVNGLLASVRFQVAGVKDFLKDLLSE